MFLLGSPAVSWPVSATTDWHSQWPLARTLHHHPSASTSCSCSRGNRSKSAETKQGRELWPFGFGLCFLALLQQYVSAKKQCFSFTTNQHQQQSNFSETNRAGLSSPDATCYLYSTGYSDQPRLSLEYENGTVAVLVLCSTPTMQHDPAARAVSTYGISKAEGLKAMPSGLFTGTLKAQRRKMKWSTAVERECVTSSQEPAVAGRWMHGALPRPSPVLHW